MFVVLDTDALEEAGGAFVKIGQLLSTRTDILPPEFTAVLGALQQEVPPVPWDEIATVIDGALPGPRATVFAELHQEPLASASIGQVHLGTLVSGERVVVKARRPGVAALIDPSFDFIAEATRYAKTRASAARQPLAIADAVKDELLSVLPLVRKLPQRIDRISGSLASGRLNVNVRLLADRRDRRVLQDFVNLAAVAFLAGVFGVMAAMLLTSTTGPVVTPTLTLFQIFGYLLLVVSGVLALRVFFDTFRRR